MQAFKHRLNTALTLVIFLTGGLAYQSVAAETTETAEHGEHHAQNNIDWPGIYNGFTPCADCIGVKTTLALNKNDTYMLITQYAGKSEREFVEKGKFSWNDKSNIITLTPRNSETTHQYLVAENMLIQLDSKGERIMGKLADKYILRRNNVTESEPKHSH